MENNTLRIIEEKMKKTVDGLKIELATIRTGRASPGILEHIKVDYGGVLTPLNHIAGISAPEASLLVIQPWDKSSIRNIEKAIQTSDLGLNPMSDGNILRINIPPLSEERRREMTKLVKKRVEERKIAIRNLRREAADELKELEKNKDVSQDEHKRALNQLQQLTDNFIDDTDKIGSDKEVELLES